MDSMTAAEQETLRLQQTQEQLERCGFIAPLRSEAVPPRTVSTLLLSSLFAICWATTIEVGYGFSYTLDSQLTQSLDKIFGIYLLMNGMAGLVNIVIRSRRVLRVLTLLSTFAILVQSVFLVTRFILITSETGKEEIIAQCIPHSSRSDCVEVARFMSIVLPLVNSLVFVLAIVSWWFLLTVGFPKPSEEEKLLDETDSFLPAYAEPVPIYDPSPSLPSSSF